MLYDHVFRNQIKCKMCGSVYFNHKEFYEIEEIAKPDCDKGYYFYNKKDVIVCAECGRFFDESSMGKRLGIVKERNR